MKRDKSREAADRSLRRLRALAVVVAAAGASLLGSTADAAVIDRASVSDGGTVGSGYVGDVSEGAGGRTLVAWAEGPAGRARRSSGQAAPPVYGPIYGDYLLSDSTEWAQVAPEQWVNDVDIADQDSRPVVAWVTNAGLFLAEMTGATWGAPVQLRAGVGMAIAAVQPVDGSAVFVAAVRSGAGARLLLVQRDSSGWSVRDIGPTSPHANRFNVDAAWISPGSGGAPPWWNGQSIAVLAPNARDELRTAVWSSGSLIPVKNYRLRRGQGGLVTHNGALLAHLGGQARRGDRQGTYQSFPAGPATIRTQTLNAERPYCDVNAFGAGIAGDQDVLLSSGGCGVGIGAEVGGKSINLMPGRDYYPLMIGSGVGLGYTSVLTWLYSNRSLWVLWIK